MADTALREAREEFGVDDRIERLVGVHWEPTWRPDPGMNPTRPRRAPIATTNAAACNSGYGPPPVLSCAAALATVVADRPRSPCSA